MNDIQTIQNKIYEIRGQRVMLDFDLAAMYGVETKRLNEQVKRNIERFPEDFMFQLTKGEYEILKSQNATSKTADSKEDIILKSQNATSSWGGTRKSPYAFTRALAELQSKEPRQISRRRIGFIQGDETTPRNANIDQIRGQISPVGGGKNEHVLSKNILFPSSLLRRLVSYAAGLFFALLLFASCQDGQFPKVGTYENAEGEYYHFCTGNNFHCKISEIDHLLSGTYELLGDSTILLTFFDEDGKATGDEIALHFSQCTADSFYIEPVGGSPMHKKKFAKME